MYIGTVNHRSALCLNLEDVPHEDGAISVASILRYLNDLPDACRRKLFDENRGLRLRFSRSGWLTLSLHDLLAMERDMNAAHARGSCSYAEHTPFWRYLRERYPDQTWSISRSVE